MVGTEWRAKEDEVLEGSRRALKLGAREAYGEWVRDLRPWSAFVTLTFDPKGWLPSATGPGYAVSNRSALRRFTYYLDHLTEAVGRPAVGVIALQHHASGEPHGHGLVHIEGEPQTGQLHQLAELWEHKVGNGWARHEVPRFTGQVARYCATYMVRESGELVFSGELRCRDPR